MQDDSLPSWLPRLAVQRGPRFLQIADALQAAVADGSLKPGDRLPPQRLLAAQLDVDLTTITRAYDEPGGATCWRDAAREAPMSRRRRSNGARCST